MFKKNEYDPKSLFEKICKNNGVKYDTSVSTDHIDVIVKKDVIKSIDSGFNLFDDLYSYDKNSCYISPGKTYAELSDSMESSLYEKPNFD